MEQILLNKKYKILSGSTLKVLALTTMIIDHIAYVLMPCIPIAVFPFLLIGSHEISIFYICRLIGRFAFPIYGFLLVEGYIHTHSRKQYGINLLSFAVISEIPWNLEHAGSVLLYSSQNVFFTLFLGFLCMYCYDRYKEDSRKLILSLGGLFLISILLRADYGSIGMFYILFIYLLKEHEIARSFIGTSFFARPWAVTPAFAAMLMYNGKRGFIKGKFFKYVFYAAYPLHILALYIIRVLYLGGYQ